MPKEQKGFVFPFQITYKNWSFTVQHCAQRQWITPSNVGGFPCLQPLSCNSSPLHENCLGVCYFNFSFYGPHLSSPPSFVLSLSCYAPSSFPPLSLLSFPPPSPGAAGSYECSLRNSGNGCGGLQHPLSCEHSPCFVNSVWVLQSQELPVILYLYITCLPLFFTFSNIYLKLKHPLNYLYLK